MPVKYNIVWSLAFVMLGILQLTLALLVIGSGGESSAAIGVGPVLTVVGFLSMVNPLYALSGDELQVRNLFGMTLLRHGIDRLKVETEGKPGEKRLYVVKKSGKAKRLMSTQGVFLRREQVAALIHEVESRKAF